MKKFLIMLGTAGIILLGAVTLFGKENKVLACTKDAVGVVTTISFYDEALKTNPDSEGRIETAFIDTAKELTLEGLQSQEGFVAFVNKIGQEDRPSIRSIEFPEPAENASCGRN